MSRRSQFTMQQLILITLIAGVMAAILVPMFFYDGRHWRLRSDRARPAPIQEGHRP